MSHDTRQAALGATLALAAILSMGACDEPLPSGPEASPSETSLAVVSAHAGMRTRVSSMPEVFPYPGGETVPVPADVWSRVEGAASFRCVEGGTEVEVRLRGLIPGGLYTIWNLLFDGSGTRTAIGALGPSDGSGNVMRAAGSGSAQLVTVVPAGSLSISGSAGSCLTRETALVQLVVAYHTDDRDHGPVPGPAGTVVNHVRFSIHRELPRESSDQSMVLPFPGAAVSPVTEEQWEAARARAVVRCTDAGTEVRLSFRGLVPNGVYTVWNLLFDSSGGRIGIGALGADDGSENGFVASTAGSGGLTVTVAAGPLSMSGAAGSCLLLDEAEFHLAAAYHVDGLNHGPTPGPAGTVFTQLGMIFVN